MALVIPKSKVVVKDLELDEEVWGSNHGAQASFRQARQGDVERLASQGPRYHRSTSKDEIRTDFNYQNYKREVVFATLVACNVSWDTGDDIFTFKDEKLSMTDKEFKTAWDALDADIAEALADAAFEVNPTLQPSRL